MPTIEILLDDLESLLGVSLPQDENSLTEVLSYVKGEVEAIDGNNLVVELKDGNRPDLWCVEGIARALRGILGVELGLKKYEVEGYSGVDVYVDPKLRKIRPYIGCSVVKGVKLTSEVIRELMHFQDKLDQTYGRKRQKASIGMYRLGLISPPIHYKAAKPDEYQFIPLGGEEPMSLREILRRHSKGIEYGHIVSRHRLWPILVDDANNVLSFPPIINSADLGKITEGEQDIFVEVTGVNPKTVLNTVTLVTLSLADRGEAIQSVHVNYPNQEVQETPMLQSRSLLLRANEVSRILGMNLEAACVVELLHRARYGAVNRLCGIEVEIPCYRIDIMHSLDVVEDVIIAYGFNNIPPLWPKIPTKGGITRLEELSNVIREIMVGLQFQEILTFSLSNLENQGTKMGLRALEVVELANPRSTRFTCVRSWLLPSILEFLANNKHASFPQKVFEVGDCVVLDISDPNSVREIRKLAAAVSHPTANFSELKSLAESIFRSLGLSLAFKEHEHLSFIPGRVGSIMSDGRNVGIIGELSPTVLDNWSITNPVAALEVDLYTLFSQLL
ncbi:MAG: phenylalanine--tRNA ligase subunit beta [Candidatus Bathyarchaeia archaeon]